MGFRKTPRPPREGVAKRDVVTLDDLAPRREVRGGSARRVFGADPVQSARSTEEDGLAGNKTTKKAKDLPPKKSPKGGLASGYKVPR